MMNKEKIQAVNTEKATEYHGYKTTKLRVGILYNFGGDTFELNLATTQVGCLSAGAIRARLTIPT